ncbi:hypothetical protein TUM4433_07210 [Shewanella schlegeliana]|nr:hypothetical protein TUM4433_07210 [Shewanella schlegeliana]
MNAMDGVGEDLYRKYLFLNGMDGVGEDLYRKYLSLNAMDGIGEDLRLGVCKIFNATASWLFQ